MKENQIVDGARGNPENVEVFIEEEHNYLPPVSQSVILTQQGQKEIAPSKNSLDEETQDVQSVTLRRSTRVREDPERFEYYSKSRSRTL